MGCKVQSIWHIWTVLLAPLCKAPAFFTQLCRNTDHNVWNVLILSEVFNNFLFYILHILHFLFQNSLCSCLFSPPAQEDSAQLQVPEGQKWRCPAAAVLPQGGAAEMRGTPASPEEAELLGRGRAMARTPGKQLLPGQPCRHFTAAFFMAFPRKWCASPRAMNPPSEIQGSNCTALERPGWIESSGGYSFSFFFSSLQHRENTSACIYKATPNYYVNAACWSEYFSFWWDSRNKLINLRPGVNT